MNSSHVTVSSEMLKERIYDTLDEIEDEREQARHRIVAEKLELIRNNWWRKWRRLPVPTFDELYVQEEKKAASTQDTAFYYCKSRHLEHERQLRLMLTACELQNEVTLTLQDLKYLNKPVHAPIPTIFPR